MPNPVVHFEIRSKNPDRSRAFYSELFGWEYEAGSYDGYTFCKQGQGEAIPGAISPLQKGGELVTFFVGVQDVAAALEAAEKAGGKIIQEATKVPGVTFGLLEDPNGQVVGVAAAG